MQATLSASTSLSTIIPRSVPCFTNAQVKPLNFVSHRAHTGISTTHVRRNNLRIAAAENEGSSAPESVALTPPTLSDYTDPEETIFYEGNGSDAELALSVLLGATLVYLPLTMASIGRRLWMNYKFTSKRIIITVASPLVKRIDQIEYADIKEIRTAPRAFGLWGDCVIFLKNGSRLEIAGLEKIHEIRDYVEGKLVD